MRVLQTDFFRDENIGLYAKASDGICVIGNHIPHKRAAEIGKVIGAEVFQTNIANSEIVGIFCALNSNGILLPKIASQDEIESFKGIARERGMSLTVVKTKFTALGNLILCNDKGAIVSRLLSHSDKKAVENCLGVKSEYCTVAGLNNVGSCGIATNRGCVLHRDASEEELDKFQEVLQVDTDIGTANFGSPFLGSCGIASSNGVVLGEGTTGPEATRIMETLGLL